MGEPMRPGSKASERWPDTAPLGYLAAPYRFAPAAFASPRYQAALLAALRGNIVPAGRLVGQAAQGRPRAADGELDRLLATASTDDPSQEPPANGEAAPLVLLYEQHIRHERAMLLERVRVYPGFTWLLTEGFERRLRAGQLIAEGCRTARDGEYEPIPREAWRDNVQRFAEAGSDGLRFQKIGAIWFRARIIRQQATIPVALAGVLVAGEDVPVGCDAPFLPAAGVLGSLAASVREAVLTGEIVLVGERGNRRELIPRDAVDRYPIDFDTGKMGPFRHVRAALPCRAEMERRDTQRKAEVETMAARLAAIEDGTELMPPEAAAAYRDGEPAQVAPAPTPAKTTAGALQRAERNMLAEIERRLREGKRITRDDVIATVLRNTPGASERTVIKAWGKIAPGFRLDTPGRRPTKI